MIKTKLVLPLLSFFALLGAANAQSEDYPACAYTPGYVIDYDDPTEAFLMVNCLSHPDPSIRDEIAYASIVEILRNHTPDAPDLFELQNLLVSRLDEADRDANGFQGPFAALALAEIARTDIIHEWMTPEMRSDLVTIGAEYLAGVSDYRGFDEAEGWRHGVAHGADLLMQLSRTQITEDDGLMILAAVASQVAPQGDHAYVFGEPIRLARPVLFLARRGVVSEESWDAFFTQLAPNDEDPRWQAPYASQEGLALLHNVRAFASALYVNADASEDETLHGLRDRALELLASMP